VLLKASIPLSKTKIRQNMVVGQRLVLGPMRASGQTVRFKTIETFVCVIRRIGRAPDPPLHLGRKHKWGRQQKWGVNTKKRVSLAEKTRFFGVTNDEESVSLVR
jgi:hypothetical protein